MENAHLNPSYAHRNGGLEAGDYAAIISVSDTYVDSLRMSPRGPSIRPSPQNPTGLGLLMIYGFPKQCRAYVASTAQP
jgi:hypothetical protein